MGSRLYSKRTQLEFWYQHCSRLYLEILKKKLLITSLAHNKKIVANNSTDIILQYKLTKDFSLIYVFLRSSVYFNPLNTILSIT